MAKIDFGEIENSKNSFRLWDAPECRLEAEVHYLHDFLICDSIYPC